MTLLLKLLVPTGHTIGNEHGRMINTICSGVAQITMAMDMPGKDYSMLDRGKTEMSCAFSGLSVQALGAVDPALLILALAFVAAVALRSVTASTFEDPPYLRPILARLI